ncbi:MAG: hypothetical protein DMG40_21495 [Acidobacteria bacterium]|nr:MAG: hypothetical protein DMG40_21495 [Acidobacteriota bacterium]
MPDWQELVRRRLSGLALDTVERDEVHAELAAHLENSYEAFCKEGLPEKEAVRRTKEQVADWRELQCEILDAKRGDLMQKRARQLWIPGFLTLILSTTFLMALQKLGFQPRIVSGNDTTGTILFYVPWLMSLPFLGALGAYFWARARASRSTVLLASVFPVLALAAALICMFPIGMIIEDVVGNHVDFGIVATAMLKDGTSWLLVPGAALFLGGLLVSFLFCRRAPSQSTAIGSETTRA